MADYAAVDGRCWKKAPSTRGTTPSTGGTTPSIGGTTPSTGGMTPSTGGTTPSTGGTTPNTVRSTPSIGGMTPSTGGTTPTTEGMAPSTVAMPPCPPTWSQWQEKCFKMHDGYGTWAEGKQICVESGGVIAVPQSEEELQHLLNMCGFKWIWIGCSDIQTEDTWVCLNGEGTIDKQDKRWAYGEPDGRGGLDEDCAAAVDVYGWHDRECDSGYISIICERPVAL
ncbi:snaclec 27-like [Asterias amurensis]|uniref:snaclec 27-like n=1 Tax=Asterias amurensis TaxID=7602 RepID=UPI003AB6AC99